MAGPDVAAPAGVRERIAALVAAGEALKARPVEEVLEVVAEACRRWRGPGPDREAGEEALAGHYGLPRRSIAEILDTAFSTWTVESLRDWITVELGDPAALDGFVRLGGVRRRSFGPRLSVFLAARGVPTTPVADLVSALCVKAPAWLKPPGGGDDLAARFALTLAHVDPGIGAAVVVEGWEMDSAESTKVLESADAVIVTGGAETLVQVQRDLSPEPGLLLHGPRLSAAVVLREALGLETRTTIDALARDTAFAGQMGCLSPVVAYVEASAAETADLVRPLHAACVQRWPCPPREQAGIAERAAFAEWRAAAGLAAAAGQLTWAGDFDSPWTVVAQAKTAPLEVPLVPRTLTLIPLGDASEALHLLSRAPAPIATVGVGMGPVDRLADLARSLAEAGVERICPLGRMQSPPPDWRRDGRTTLGDLVRWVDQEVR